MKKYYIQDAGGAGDIINHYLSGHRGWGYLRGLKEKEPDAFVRVILNAANPQSKNLIELCPYIDDIIVSEWQNPHKNAILDPELINGFILLEDLKGINIQRLPFYLANDENDYVNSIVNNGPYIGIHPFASTADRIMLSFDRYKSIIDRLIDDLNYNVVVLGGTFYKEKTDTVINEEFTYNRPRLYNLVNRISLRIGVVLAQKSTGFIGTWSCFLRPGMDNRSKTVGLKPSLDIGANGKKYYKPVDGINILICGQDLHRAEDIIIEHFSS